MQRMPLRISSCPIDSLLHSFILPTSCTRCVSEETEILWEKRCVVTELKTTYIYIYTQRDEGMI